MTNRKNGGASGKHSKPYAPENSAGVSANDIFPDINRRLTEREPAQRKEGAYAEDYMLSDSEILDFSDAADS
jgi:hypothetical protein